ncbi:maleylpyruvate isomerase family mycothiol-dependent enzyme [Kribbella swartbergensis]
MTDPTILAWTEAERLDLADFLDTLDADDWNVPSLCTGWTIHHVAAHLTTSTRTTLGVALRGMIRARFDFDRMEDVMARECAARFTPAELIAQFRETAGSARRAPGAGPLDPLVDALVHGQDIARPLGRERVMPAEQTLAALEHVRNSAFYGARKRFRGMRLVATDADWSAGDGAEELRATAADLLLLATGRPAGLASATGTATHRIEAAL